MDLRFAAGPDYLREITKFNRKKYLTNKKEYGKIIHVVNKCACSSAG